MCECGTLLSLCVCVSESVCSSSGVRFPGLEKITYIIKNTAGLPHSLLPIIQMKRSGECSDISPFFKKIIYE